MKKIIFLLLLVDKNSNKSCLVRILSIWQLHNGGLVVLFGLGLVMRMIQFFLEGMRMKE